MGSVPRDDNFVPGLLVKGSSTGADVVVEGDETTKGINIQIVGDDVGIGGGTQYATNVAYADGNTGTMALAVRDDSLTTLTPADGDFVPIRVNSTGALHVTGGGGGTQYTEADTDASITGTAVMWEDASDTLRAVSAAKPLPVELKTGTASIGKLAANDGVDIGNVDVTSVISGTGATNLGKAIDSAVGATDTGIALLAKHNSDVAHLTTAEGDYDVLRLANFGGLQVAPEQHHIIDSMNVTTSWAALGNDTLNLATTKKHVLGTDALTFDKVDGAANTVFAGIAKTITSVDLGNPSPHDLIQTACYLPTITDVSYVFIRLGTDSSHYNEWRIEDTALTAATYETLLFNIGDANYAGITGNGWNPGAVTYVAIGVAFDAETNALAGIVFDEISFHTNLHTSAELNAEVSSSVSSAKVDLQKINGSVTDKGAGNVSNGSQRVVLASDQNFVHLEDAQHSSGDAGILSLAVENEDQADLSTGDKDYTPIAVTKEGNVIVKQEGAIDASGATVTVDLGGNNDVTVTSGTIDVLGDVAHDAGDSGDPIKIGGRAQDLTGTEPEEVSADNDRIDALFDMSGRMGVTAGYDFKYAAINDNTSGDNEIVAAQAAGKRIAVWAILIVSDGTTDVRFEDGAGATAFTGQVPLQAREGYSISAGGLVPLFVGSAATALNLELTAAVFVHGFVSWTIAED